MLSLDTQISTSKLWCDLLPSYYQYICRIGTVLLLLHIVLKRFEFDKILKMGNMPLEASSYCDNLKYVLMLCRPNTKFKDQKNCNWRKTSELTELRLTIASCRHKKFFSSGGSFQVKLKDQLKLNLHITWLVLHYIHTLKFRSIVNDFSFKRIATLQ